MSKEKIHKLDPGFVRNTLNEAVEKTEKLLENERLLIDILAIIDQSRLIARYGFKSLFGFCNQGLKLTRTQTQRLTIKVRQNQTLHSKMITHHAVGNDQDFVKSANTNI